LIHKCLNLLGNYLSSQFESREMGEGVPWCENPETGMRFRLRVRNEGAFDRNETSLIRRAIAVLS
jgi:hypothetical protein